MMVSSDKTMNIKGHEAERVRLWYSSVAQRMELNEINWRALRLMPLVALPVSAVNLLVRMEYGKRGGIIAGLALIFYYILLALFAKYGKKRFLKYATALIYFSEVPVMLITAMAANVFTPHVASVTALLFMVALPPFILDKPRRVICFETLWLVINVALSFVMKKEALFRMDLLHSVVAYLLSVGMVLLILDSRFRMIRSRNDLIRFSENDALTGVLNKRYFLKNVKALREMFDAREEEHDELVIVACDICDMHLYNEEYGFQEGNRLLIRTAEMLGELFPNRLVSRFESDHFYVFCFEPEVQRLERELSGYPLIGVDGVSVRMVFGYYIIRPEDTEDYACDRALFALHKVEKGQLCRCYDEAMDAEHRYQKKLLALFPKALKEEEFEVNYQPIIRSFSRQISSAEALVRWKNKDHGMISPGDFIPLLESNYLIPELDLYVVRHVLRDMIRIRERTGRLLPVSINLSRVDFVMKDMPEEICRLADEAGVEHDKLIIEITESAFAIQNGRLSNVLTRFRNYGFPVWMDDFGSGYSSLNLLRNFEFDLVKFDMRFVRELTTDPKNRLLLGKLVELTDELGMQTLVEGVETEEQRRILELMGAQRMQGFLICRPETLEILFRKQNSESRLDYEDFRRTPYLDVVSKVNLRNPLLFDFRQKNSELEREVPAGVIEVDEDGHARYIRSNEVLRRLLRKEFFADGDGEAVDTDEAAASLVLQIPEEFNRKLRKTKESDSWESLDITPDRHFVEKHVTAFGHYLASDSITGRSAYLIVAIRE